MATQNPEATPKQNPNPTPNWVSCQHCFEPLIRTDDVRGIVVPDEDPNTKYYVADEVPRTTTLRPLPDEGLITKKMREADLADQLPSLSDPSLGISTFEGSPRAHVGTDLILGKVLCLKCKNEAGWAVVKCYQKDPVLKEDQLLLPLPSYQFAPITSHHNPPPPFYFGGVGAPPPMPLGGPSRHGPPIPVPGRPYGPPGASQRDGDWTCRKCGKLNFAFRGVCNLRKCGAPRPPATLSAPMTNPSNHPPFYFGGVGAPPPMPLGGPSRHGPPIPVPGRPYGPPGGKYPESQTTGAPQQDRSH